MVWSFFIEGNIKLKVDQVKSSMSVLCPDRGKEVVELEDTNLRFDVSLGEGSLTLFGSFSVILSQTVPAGREGGRVFVTPL